MAQDALEHVRQIALALPHVTERLSAGAPCFYVRDRKPICRFHDSEFADDGRVSLWCPAPPGVGLNLSPASRNGSSPPPRVAQGSSGTGSWCISTPKAS